MRTIAIIPARGNSQRIPNKNRKLFHGRPIIEYSIETAQRSMLFDEIIVSTDDLAISQIARKAGATIFWRDTDDGTRGTQEVAVEVLAKHPAGFACVIYPCAPLIQPSDLVVAYQACTQQEVTFAAGYNKDTLQDAGQFYFGAGAYFGVESVSSSTCVGIRARGPDINTEADWKLAELLYAKSQEKAE